MKNQPWLAHYPPEIPKTLDYPDISLTSLLFEAAEQYPAHDAIYFLGSKLTYQQLLEETQKFAGGLKNLGIQKGDRVAIMLPNCPQAVIAYYGILMVGAVIVQVNPLYTTRELTFQLSDSGAQTIVCLDSLYPVVKRAREQVTLPQIIIASIEDYLSSEQSEPKISTEVESGSVAFKKLIAEADPFTTPDSIDPSEEVALLQYTGGTTGLSKGVMLTHKNLVSNVLQCRAWFYKCEQGKERFLAVVPFFHVYGMTVAMNLSICYAGCLIILPRFEVSTLLQTIQETKPSLFPGAPTMYIALLQNADLPKYDVSSIEICLCGSAPLPMEVQEQFEAVTGGRLIEGYGLTECSPVTHTNLVWGRRKNGSVGLPWPDTDAKIVDLENREPLPPGKIGEIVVKGPQVMKGYWNRPEETAEVLRDGWLYTGDLAYVDEEGFFYIVDRKKDLIIASGFNVYPREVEEVLYEHPHILEAAVIGVPDPYRGETVKAFIVFKEGQLVTEEQLDAFCRERLAPFKVPKQYEFRSDLPKTSLGKVLKRSLKGP